MTTTMAALTANNIRHAEFIKLSVGATPTVYTFCNAAAPITVGGTTYSNLGSLLMLGNIQQDMKNTSADLTISLTGIDPNNIALMLSSNIKGSLVEVWRGFLSTNNQIITTPTTQFFKRYTGIINSVSITETFDDKARTRVATCSIACCSMRKILESRIGGMKTNQKSWQFVYPGDTSMNRVSVISNQYFDFGKPPQSGSVSDSNSGTDEYRQNPAPVIDSLSGGGG
tara:strand:+ start:4598 stop:5278 length:681 start_codon:yes stop_codon:yes gene_type:complete